LKNCGGVKFLVFAPFPRFSQTKGKKEKENKRRGEQKERERARKERVAGG